ncbi:Uncharacterized conserved protein YlxW, UPF0749 family [Anaerovirgula multivorans]|uniref:Uncharacterized conserved protein YlxW, UPF0749 family n=1 Tax=Anaerovirgula multivorans TaxID=312168 RepID=A0A239LHZ2_9FIRM|nr:DUF881 domain-containing protein [Anaerovirgula multivorans]SNT29453.1 Uncharacterized conserved protein YlxW, UPF0749 family [Anaerovirgula multivorans]
MNFKGRVAIGVLCSILGLTISLQFNTVKNVTGGGSLSTQKAQQLAIELRNLRAEKEKLNKELTNLENRLKEYELSEADENLIIKNLKRDLEQHQLLAGYKEGEGSGVVITVDELQSDLIMGGEGSPIMYSNEIIMAIIAIINILNGAGAEAISINDQKYISTTEISLASNALLINSVPTRSPFIIKAIGNPETLEAALNIRYGIVWELRDYWNLQVDVKKENNVIIPRYNKVIKYEYAKPIEPIQ